MAKVDTKHPNYLKMVDQWAKCRAVVAGQKAVHAAGEIFLPRLKEQSIDDYKSYRMRALFFNATWRTVSALAGLLFRKHPVVTSSASVEKLLEDVTLSGVSFQVFSQLAAIEIMTTGRVGVLVDYPETSTDGMTIAEAEAQQVRPTMQSYQAESIINWKTSRIGNDTALSLVVLEESAEIPGDTEFEHNSESRYRVLDLENGVYRIRVFRINASKQDEQIGPDVYPRMNGKTMDRIPFYFIGVDSTTSEIDEPPIIDLVDVNLAHYRTSADYENGCHLTGLAQAVISGYSPENKNDKLYFGGPYAWCFPDPATTAQLLTMDNDFVALTGNLEKKEQQMAILGARLLTSEKKDAETSQTAQIHRAGENSILSAIAQTISIGLTNALNTFSEWAGAQGEWSIELNREFLPVGMTPQELTAWVSAQMQGVVSPQVVFWNLQQREQVPPDLTYEEMQGQIGAVKPPAPEESIA